MASFEATVRSVEPEAAGAVTLRLEAPGAPTYRGGQFLSIDPRAIGPLHDRMAALESQKGRKERPRAYSLASAPGEPLLAITVKAEPDGAYPSLLSPWLATELQVGTTLPCSGFNGFFTAPADPSPGARLVHICAGTGVVPCLSIIKEQLTQRPWLPQLLLLSNRSWAEVVHREELGALAEAHPQALTIVHALTRDTQAPAAVRVHPGRIDAALIQTHMSTDAGVDDTHVYICGPAVPEHERREARLAGRTPTPRFLETMRAVAHDLGLPRERVLTEGW